MLNLFPALLLEVPSWDRVRRCLCNHDPATERQVDSEIPRMSFISESNSPIVLFSYNKGNIARSTGKIQDAAGLVSYSLGQELLYQGLGIST